MDALSSMRRLTYLEFAIVHADHDVDPELLEQLGASADDEAAGYEKKLPRG